MKFNFRKIASVIASAVMLGSTVGTALAATYPAPFVVGGSADAAIVVTSGSHGGSAVDWDAALGLQKDLKSHVTTATTSSTGTTTTGGDSYKIERSSTKFQLGKGTLDIVSGTITDSNMENLLADGTFLDSDNNEKDYTQKIVLANLSLGMFDDNDYAEDTPTVGIKINSGDPILNYTLTFSDDPAWNKLETTNIKLLGKEYYILDANTLTNNSITLLDSAESTTIAEGETKTINVGDKSYEVTASFIGQSSVKLVVNGETTNSLAAAQTYRLSDGSYVGIKEILYTAKDTGTSQVEFSIGSGKLQLTHGRDVELNEDTIPELKAYLGGNGTANLQSITIEWKADGDLFVAPNSEPTMPGFEAVKLVWGGMTYPVEENIVVEAGSDTYITLKNFPLQDSTEDINILYGNNSDWTGVGKDSNNRLATVGSGNLTFNKTYDYFVATYDDGTNAESYLMRATDFITSSGTNKTTIEYKNDGDWKEVEKEVQEGDEVSIGSVTLTIGAINYNRKSVVIAPGSHVNFNTLYSKEGLKVYLPWVNSTLINIVNATQYANDAAACTAAGFSLAPGELHTGKIQYNKTSTGPYNGTCVSTTTFNLTFSEEDRNENKGSGENITAVLGWNSATTPQAHVSDVVGEDPTFAEQDDTDVYESHVYSPLATKLLWDKSGDQDKLTLVYHGSESYGNVFVAEPSVSVTSESTTTEESVLVVKDTEIDSVKDKNLIVVGGSCINSVAAKVLGLTYPTCGADFTAATNVDAGKYLIKAVASPYNSEKTAVVVAGYEASDTKNGVLKLQEGVATDVGTEIIGPTVG